MTVACYTRVSTTEQSEHGYSLDEQRSRLESYCAAMGWTVYKVYTDGGFSGGNTDRPALQAMIRDIQRHRVQKVVVWKLDRLSRSQLDTLYLIEKVFLANGADFVSMSENFDTSSPFGRAMIGILAVFAQLEREQIKERMYIGKQARAKSGKWQGNAPIGYDYDRDTAKLIINDYEAALVRRIFNEFEAGKPINQICTGLNDAGLLHNGIKFFITTIRRMLPNRTYLGETSFSGTWVTGTHTPIISEEQFKHVQLILENRSAANKKYGRRFGSATAYLTGYIRCPCCGRNYEKYKTYSDAKDGTRHYYEYYKCASRIERGTNKKVHCTSKPINMDYLDNLVFEQIKRLASDPEYFSECEDVNAKENEIAIIFKKQTSIDTQIERLLDLYADDKIPHDTLTARISSLQNQRNALQTEIDKLHDQMQKQTTRDDALAAISSFRLAMASGNFSEIRAIIDMLIDHIEINNDNIQIFWKF